MNLHIDDLNICQSYRDLINSYDEMCDGQGQIRPHWQYLIGALHQLGSKELEKRHVETHRHLRETGVTYNTHEDVDVQHNPWQLDPIPFVIENNEWLQLEHGLIQRAELLNLVLKDIYGPKKLIKNGLLPAELIYPHEGFLRACNDLQQESNHTLYHYAADLVRQQNGQFVILGDRTQSPAGAGYALENRTIMRRVLPSLFRDSHVHRLALFFRAMRSGFGSLSTNTNGQSRTVLLTPGPDSNSDNYFEHSYLATYLGLALVQGNDLTSRSGKIWLKSLDGLQPVDVIYRRVDDFMCDPLELNQHSNQGIPGLLNSLRQGNVSIINSIGSGILENPALQVFLPNICKQLMGQDLIIPTINTWWCGQNLSLKYVLENFDQLIIKSISKNFLRRSVMPSEMTTPEKEKLKQMILSKPHLYVAQHRIEYSTTPTLIQGQLEPRATMLRTFLSLHAGSYMIMPGGLTRVVSQHGEWYQQVNKQTEIISKDTWVLASEPERKISLWKSANTYTNKDYAGVGSLPSRAADNLFWLGRLAERAEDFIRLFKSLCIKIEDMSEFDNEMDKDVVQLLYTALATLTVQQEDIALFDESKKDDPIEQLLINMLIDDKNPASLAFSINSMIYSASSVRDLLSADTMRIINNVESIVKKWKFNPPTDLLETIDELDKLISSLAAFSGLLLESTTREQGWLFLTIGRRMERSHWLAGLISQIMIDGKEELSEQMLLESLLSSHESLMTYRRRYRSGMEMYPTLELILMDQSNPRSLLYQLERLNRAINSLPVMNKQIELTRSQRLILKASNLIKLAELETLCQLDAKTNKRLELEKVLEEVTELLNQLSNTITEVYFNHTTAPKQLTHFTEV